MGTAKKFAITSALVLGMLCVAGTASAIGNYASGYLCGVAYSPQTTGGNGNFGYISFSMTSAPACAGSYLGSGYLYTTGATNSDSDPLYRFSEAGIFALHQAMRAATHDNQRVIVNTCSSSGGYCTKTLFFYAN